MIVLSRILVSFQFKWHFLKIIVFFTEDQTCPRCFCLGPVGMAAAAAVATGKKRKRPHIFESNPSIRKRQQTRLLRYGLTLDHLCFGWFWSLKMKKDVFVFYRKLRATLDEYTTRVGQQAIVLCISPSKPNPVFKVFGAAPLENVVRKQKGCKKRLSKSRKTTNLKKKVTRK